MNSEGKIKKSKWIPIISAVLLLACAVLAAICYHMGLLTSVDVLQSRINKTGIWGATIFVLIQALQVVIPVLPGGISCLAGVVMFGGWKGFLWNYIGICIGSIIAFFISRSCGKPLLYRIFSEKLMNKYEEWTDEKHHFTKLFAIAIFLPVAPDDFLTLLLKRFWHACEGKRWFITAIPPRRISEIPLRAQIYLHLYSKNGLPSATIWEMWS